MSDEWEEVSLGDAKFPLVSIDSLGKVVTGATPKTRVSEYWKPAEVPFVTPADLGDFGLVTDTARFVSQAGAQTARIVQPNAVMVVCIGTVGKIGVSTQAAITNQQINSVTGLTKTDALLLAAALSTEAAQVQLLGDAGKSVLPILNKSKFSRICVPWPSVHLRNRIVDLLEHLDTLIANLERERSAAATTLARSTFEILMDRSSGDEVVISSLLDRNIGGLWGDGLGTDDLDVAVFRSTEFTNDGYLSGPAEAMRSVSERQYESRSLAAGDILVEKSGGTVGRPVGRVVWVSEVDVAQSAIGANFLQLIRPNTESVAGRYLFWLLWSHHKHGIAEQYQRATTSIRNLRTKEYLGRPVFLPSREEQEIIATALDSIQKLILSLDVELASMKDLRSATLTSLLSREIEIPESYDELLGVAS